MPKRTAYYTGSTTAAGVIIDTIKASNYGSFSLQLVGTWVGTVVVNVSNDRVNWAPTRMQNAQDATALQGALSADSLYRGPIEGRYLQVVANSYTSGTVTAHLHLSEDVFTSVVKST